MNLRVLMMPDYRKDNPYQTLLSDALREGGVEVEFPRGYRRGLPISRAMRDAGADILHLHWIDPYASPRAPLPVFIGRGLKTLLDLTLVRAQGGRIVWTIHNEVSHESKRPRLERLLMDAIERLASRVIVHEQTRRKTHPGAVVIPHGTFAPAYAPPIARTEAHAALRLSVTGRVFLHFGMLRPYKGTEELLDAWAAEGLGREHQLLIAGQPQDERYGDELKARADSTEGVRLVPEFVAPERVHLYFSAADVVALPFRQVSTSGSAILALSFGRPVIVPSFPGLLESLGDPPAALTYDPTERGGLAAALRRAATEDLGPLLALAHARACQDAWAEIGTRTRAAYEVA